MNTLFEYKDYKHYLKDLVKQKPKQGHGFKSAMATAIRCQSAYISRVLNGNAHLSLEQAHELNQFLGHSEEEAEFFILLVLYTRAGTQILKNFFLKKINHALNKRLILKERFKVKMTLAAEDQARYYSSWPYAAIHIATSIPQLETKKAISDYLDLPLPKVSEILDFLCRTGLVIKKGDHFTIGKTRIHLGSDSALISQHHTHWRIKAIQNLDQKQEDTLHYSSMISLSKEDIQKIKTKLVKTIEEYNAIVKDSKEEELRCLTLDFFGLQN